MDDLLVVHVLERVGGLADVVDRVLDRQPRPPVLLEHAAEVRALDELHHDVLARLVLEVVHHPHHARVAELGEEARLDLETGRVTQVHEPLHGDLAALLAVLRPVDGAHRAARDRRQDLVTALQLEPSRKVADCRTTPHKAEPSVRVGKWPGWRSSRSSSYATSSGTICSRPTGRRATSAAGSGRIPSPGAPSGATSRLTRSRSCRRSCG